MSRRRNARNRAAASSRARASIAGAKDPSEASRVAAGAIARMLDAGDDVVVNAIEDGGYRVLAGTPTNVEGLVGRVADHPVLGRVHDTSAIVTLRADEAEVLATLDAREVSNVPLRSGDRLVGSVLILRRARRPAPIPVDVFDVLDALTFAVADAQRAADLERLRLTEARMAASASRLAVAVRLVGESEDPDVIVRHVLKAADALVGDVVGAVAGLVSEGAVVHVASSGWTVRTIADALRGTWLQAFPAGRRMLADPAPFVVSSEEVSPTTRAEIMEPLGARSLLAAAGRDGFSVRIVLSLYRTTDEAPPEHTTAALGVLLAHAAVAIARSEQAALARLLADAPDGAIVVRDRMGSVGFANATARAMSPSPLEPRLYGIDGEPMPQDELPWTHAGAGERVEDVKAQLLPDGRPVIVTSAPLPLGGSVTWVREPRD